MCFGVMSRCCGNPRTAGSVLYEILLISSDSPELTGARGMFLLNQANIFKYMIIVVIGKKFMHTYCRVYRRLVFFAK